MAGFSFAKTITEVLHNTEQQKRKMHSDYRREIRDFLKIHNSKKTHSPSGATIEHKSVNSRKTYYTGEQELYK